MCLQMVGRQIKTSQQEKPLSPFPFTEHRKKVEVQLVRALQFQQCCTIKRVVGVYDHTSSRGIRRKALCCWLPVEQAGTKLFSMLMLTLTLGFTFQQLSNMKRQNYNRQLCNQDPWGTVQERQQAPPNHVDYVWLGKTLYSTKFFCLWWYTLHRLVLHNFLADYQNSQGGLFCILFFLDLYQTFFSDFSSGTTHPFSNSYSHPLVYIIPMILSVWLSSPAWYGGKNANAKGLGRLIGCETDR